MSQVNIQVGTLAFVGPLQHEAFSSFQYVEVTRLQDDTTTVKVTGPELPRLAKTVKVPSSVLASRTISTAEANWWPGSYVSIPVAFVLRDGPDMGNWCYGVVTTYCMDDNEAFLVVRYNEHSCRIKLTEPSSVIKVEPLIYALQPWSGVSSTAVNVTEMLALLHRLGASCRQTRSAAPATESGALCPSFPPDGTLPLVLPTDLRVRSVRRQHIVDCELQLNHKRKRDLLADTDIAPASTEPTRRRRSTSNSSVSGTAGVLVRRDDPDDIDVYFLSSDFDDDVREVRRQNEPLEQPARRLRRIYSPRDDGRVPGDHRNAVAFRPSSVERQVHDVIIHPAYEGKDAQALLELWQRSDQSRFLATPPTCRGLYDIGFGERGLSIMHLTTITMAARVRAKEAGVNMADFSRRNILRASPEATSLHQILSALQTSASSLSNSTNEQWSNLSTKALSRYGDDAHMNIKSCKVFVFWIDSKLGKYRSRILAGGLPDAAQIGDEFSRTDEELAELKEYFAEDHTSNQSAQPVTHGRRESRRDEKTTIPITVTNTLPRQNGREFCLRYLSKAGCRGNFEGRCSRGHFKPHSLPAAARKVIEDRFNGLASQFHDL